MADHMKLDPKETTIEFHGELGIQATGFLLFALISGGVFACVLFVRGSL